MKKVLLKMMAILGSAAVLSGAVNVSSVHAQEEGQDIVSYEQRVYAAYNVAAPAFSLETLEGDTITQDTYGSKTQLLVFYRGDGRCYNSNNTLKSLASSNWISSDAVQVIAIEAIDSPRETVASFKDSWAPNGDIVWAYGGSGTMGSYVRSTTGGGRITFAVCAVVQDGKILELWDGCTDASICETELRKHVNLETGQVLMPVEDFVTRLYRVGLGRTPEETGLNDWSRRLKNGEADAVNVVQGVLCSPEYLGKGKSNEDMVTDCYNAMLSRDPDDEGLRNWVAGLDAGMSINAIFAGFVGSREFANLCARYQIRPGTYPVTEERDKNAGVTKFVSRLYTEALGRGYDIDGLNNWCGQINANPGKDNIMNVATNGFFHSPEFMNKGLDNTAFVKVCYRTFLGRDYDKAGLTDWVRKLDSGEKTRDQVMEGFAYSQEFGNIMAGYGL